MTAIDPLDEQKSVRLRQRLWGAAVFIALLVIFLPLLLDGSGSESQYRRVERLRAEPPRVLGADGIEEQTAATASASKQSEQQVAPKTGSTTTENTTAANSAAETPVETPKPRVPSDVSATVSRSTNTGTSAARSSAQTSSQTQPLSAWVVQAGSFSEEANALAVRDRLRSAGFPSFVTPSETGELLFRVRVGPMISRDQAESSRNKVMRLLKREAIVVSYP